MKEKHGAAGLKPNRIWGGLSVASDQEELKQLLLADPQAAGFDSALWTCRRVAQVIEQTFGVSYHPNHGVVCCMGWAFRASIPSIRRENGMRRPSVSGVWWNGYELKKAQPQGTTITLVDQSGFMLQPTRRRTWALLLAPSI